MEGFTPNVLEQLRQSMVFFVIGKKDMTVGWGSGFACFPNTRAILTCMHNFIGAIPDRVVARHTMSSGRYHVGNVAWSERLDCAIAILDRPIDATPLLWADDVQAGDPVAVPDYVRGVDSTIRLEVAAKGRLERTTLKGVATDRIMKGANWIGSSDRANDTRSFDIRGVHPGQSGSPIVNREGRIVGQCAHLESDIVWNAINSHFLDELHADAGKIYADAEAKGFLK